jgi:hypothetical protein
MEEIKVVSDDSKEVLGSTENKEKDVVAYETHKKLLAQRKADQEKQKSLVTELEELKAEKQQREEQLLAEQGKYKEIAQLKDKELAATKEQIKQQRNLLINGAKLQAFKEKVGGEFKQPEYMSFVDLEKIIVLEDGTLDEGSLENSVNIFLKKHGENLLRKTNGKKLPNDASTMGGIHSTKPMEKMNKNELTEKLNESLRKALNVK